MHEVRAECRPGSTVANYTKLILFGFGAKPRSHETADGSSAQSADINVRSVQLKLLAEQTYPSSCRFRSRSVSHVFSWSVRALGPKLINGIPELVKE